MRQMMAGHQRMAGRMLQIMGPSGMMGPGTQVVGAQRMHRLMGLQAQARGMPRGPMGMGCSW